MVEGLREAGGFLFGRRTYELLGAYWPNAPEEERAVAEPLNALPKHVASTTLQDPLEWGNATVLHGDVPGAVAALKAEDGGDLVVIGSANWAKSLESGGAPATSTASA